MFDFVDFERAAPLAAPWGELRRKAYVRFGELGLPTIRREEWRETNVSALSKQEWRRAADAPHVLPALPVALTNGPRLVVIDGHVALEASRLDQLAGLTCIRLESALNDAPRVVPAWSRELGQVAAYSTQAFVALNTAFLSDGWLIEVAPRTTIAPAIEVVYVTTGAYVSHPRLLVVLGEGSSAALIERFVGSPDATYFTNAVTEISLAENATLRHYKLCEEGAGAYHLATTAVSQAAHSVFEDVSLSFGGKLVRYDLSTRLLGEGSQAVLNGLYLATGEQHVDHHTRIEHLAQHTVSEQLYKGILNDHAKGVFNGRIVVAPNAQKTDAKQSNKNLLLSNRAAINSKPELEIAANDVKCRHGSATGQLDAEALFYLRSRGLSQRVAEQLLLRAFANEVTSTFSDPQVEDYVTRALETRLEVEARP